MPTHATLTTDQTFTGANTFSQKVQAHGLDVTDGPYGIYLTAESEAQGNIYTNGDKLTFVAPDAASYEWVGSGGNATWDFSLLGQDQVYTFPNETGTIITSDTRYEDIRVTPGSFDRPGSADPGIVSVTPGGSGTTTWLWEFAKGDIASFSVQIPHSYKVGEDIKVHVHWTPGANGNEENGATVGWKIDYTWSNINSNFGSMNTLDLSDACDGTDWKHQMSPDVVIDGHTVAKGISSMLICNIKRTDTGTDDAWAGTASGSLPLLLEVDFHFPVDSLGSTDWGTK